MVVDHSRSPDASIRFTTLVYREPMDQFSKLSLGMGTFFRGIETLHEANKSRVLDTINRAVVFVGVVAEPRFTDQHLNAIYAIADELEGMVFDGYAVTDCKGVVLLDRDGGADEDSEDWVRLQPTESLSNRVRGGPAMAREPVLPRYDRSHSYRWNYDHAPESPPAIDVPPVPGKWPFCDRPVSSPLGVAAGPLLNGRWVLYYAALGFDVLTYKTVRSVARECYPLPNLQPVRSGPIEWTGDERSAAGEMHVSWAISFGMPSMAPDVWRADVEWTRTRLPKEKLLSVSVIAGAGPDWSLDDLADDYARCARWVVESGADCVEANFSCPNVATCDGQLYQQPEAAAIVANRVREAIGSTPLLIKVGHIHDEAAAAKLLDAVAPFADALSMTNCIAAKVRDERGALLFGGDLRGIGGEAIREASVGQVRLFSNLIRERGLATRIIGVGGVSTARHAREYLDAGAEAVQLATAVMVDPLAGCRSRRALN